MKRLDVARSAFNTWPNSEGRGTATLEILDPDCKGTGEFVTISGVTREAFKPNTFYVISLPDSN